MASYDNTDRNAYVTLGMMFGLVAGLGAGMLLAPRSGRETREQIRERAMMAKDKAKEHMHETRDMAMEKLNKTLDRSKDMASKVVDKAADKTKEMADKTAQRAKDAADEAKAESRRYRSSDQ